MFIAHNFVRRAPVISNASELESSAREANACAAVLSALRAACVIAITLSVPAVVFGQGTDPAQANARVTVNTAAPVYLMPDATRVPLRTLAAGTTVTIGRSEKEWVQITFNDPQFNRRTGWIQRKFLTFSGAQAEPAPSRPPDARSPATQKPPAPRSATPPRVQPPQGTSARVFGTVGFDRMMAAESFKAITASSAFPSFGAGVQVVNLWSGLFVESGVERMSTTGERAFVFDDEVFPLGIPLKVTTLPIDVMAGWRFRARNVVPFVAGGATFLRYEETSDFADDEENVQSWNTGLVAVVGVETQVARSAHVRGEFRFRHVPNAIGEGGVSQAFGESALGGWGGGIKIVFGR